MSEFTLFVTPFKNLSDYFRRVFILINYSEQTIYSFDSVYKYINSKHL